MADAKARSMLARIHSRASAEAASRLWAERNQAAEAARTQRRNVRPTNAPPDYGGVWVTAKTAALALGITPGGWASAFAPERSLRPCAATATG